MGCCKLNDYEYLQRKLSKVIFLAGNGFYQTIGENKIASKLFLEIIKEAYKAKRQIYQMNSQGVEKNANSRDKQ